MGTQRGNGFGLYIVYLFFRFFGYIGLHLVLGFVVFYFVITTPTLKRYLRHYYLLCTGKFNFFIYYRHIYTFALVFSDRFLSKKFSYRYKITAKNYKSYLSDSSKGVMFLFSHVGDWSTCELLPSENNTPINIVMNEVVKKSIKKFEKSLKQGSDSTINTIKVIDLSEGSISVALQVAKAFQNGEIVAMMADRWLTKSNSISVIFLDRTILINKNPFEVAYNRRVPLIAFFSLRESDYHYQANYYWLNAYDYSIDKEQAIANIAQEYTNILERIVREHPDQWFNHYDFFGTETSTYEPAR
jgi:predicted LPLAT superfamily acyltransferase